MGRSPPALWPCSPVLDPPRPSLAPTYAPYTLTATGQDRRGKRGDRREEKRGEEKIGEEKNRGEEKKGEEKRREKWTFIIHEDIQRPLEAAEGRTAHNNGWNGANGNHGNHVSDVFDTIPLIPVQPLPRACPPPLRCHQPPVSETNSTSQSSKLCWDDVLDNTMIEVIMVCFSMTSSLTDTLGFLSW